ncbi:MAG: phage tail tape measure protein, partial [Bacteroides sp.]|nr:phage tail tape measure protein [Bacteroides sp.]
TAAVKTGMEFEQEMSTVAATAGITSISQEYADLEEAALNAANTTKYTATEAAEGLNFLKLSGIEVEEAIDALPGVLNLAAAGNMELGTASDLATDALAALGDTLVTAEGETVSLKSLMDQMAKTAQSSNTNVAQLGEATLEAAGSANLFGMSLTDMNAELGILANRGLKGSEGGQKLRNVLLALASPTQNAAAQLKALGVSVADDEGEIRDLDAILQDLNGSLAELTEEERTQAIAAIFNKRDIAAVNALLAGAGEEFASLTEKIEDSEGAAQQMAETMLDNLSGALDILKSNLSTTGIEIKKLADGALKSLVNEATEAVVGFRTALEEGGAEGALAYVEALIPTLGTKLVDGLAAIVPESQKGFDRLLTAGIESLIENIPGAVERVAYPLLEEFRQTVSNVTEGVKDDLPDAIGSVGGLIIDSVPVIIDAGFELFAGIAKGLGEALPDLLAKAGEAVKQIGDDIQENKGEFIEAGSELLYGVLAGIDEALPNILIGVGEIAEGIVETFYTSIFNAFKQAASDGTASTLEKLIVGVLSPPALAAQEIIEGILRGAQTEVSIQQQRNEMFREMEGYILDLLKQGKDAGEAIRQAQHDLFGEDTEKMKFFQYEMYDMINEEIVEGWRQDLANTEQITGPLKAAGEEAQRAAEKADEASEGFNAAINKVARAAKKGGGEAAAYYQKQGEAARAAEDAAKKTGDAFVAAAYDASEAFDEEMEEVADSAEEAAKAAEEAEQERQKTANEIRSETLKSFKEIQTEEKNTFTKTLKEETEALKEEQKEQTEAVKAAQKEQTEAVKAAQKEQTAALEKAHRKRLDQIDEEYLEKLKLVDEEAYNRIKAAQAEIDAIDEQTKAEERQRELAEEAEKRSQLAAKVANAKDAAERAEAQKALADYDEEIRQKRIKEQREARKDDLNQEIEDIQKIADEEAKLTELAQKVWAADEDEKEAALKAYNDYAAQLEKERAEDGRDLRYADLIKSYQDTRDAAEAEHELKKQLEDKIYDVQKANLDAIQAAELAHLEGLQAAELKELENVQKKRLEDLEEYQEEREKIFDDAQTDEYNKLNRSLGEQLGITEDDSEEKKAEQSQSLLDAYLKGRESATESIAATVTPQKEEKTESGALITEAAEGFNAAADGISGLLTSLGDAVAAFEVAASATTQSAAGQSAADPNAQSAADAVKGVTGILTQILGAVGKKETQVINVTIPGGGTLARAVINSVNDYTNTSGKFPFNVP